MNDRIEKQIELKTPISRVWQALTNYLEFGKWFLVQVEEPFVPGKTIRGKLTYPGYENYPFEVFVQKMEPERLFSFTWHPFSIDSKRDYSKEEPTLIEFKLEEIENGTRLLLSESGFLEIPSDRRSMAYKMHDDGWTGQMQNIKNYLEKSKLVNN